MKFINVNQGVVTINLPYIALLSGGDKDKFWEEFNYYTDLCHKGLKCKHERLEGTTSEAAPIMWQYGALARLKKGEVIDKLLHGGYSTISLGFAGLYECVKYMTGESHTKEKGHEFGMEVMNALNALCKKWKAEENIDYSLYGSPIESTTEKFALALKRDFGEDVFEKIDNYDREFITNSYHIPVMEEIDAFSKLEIESQFQLLSPGGSISYVEIPNLNNNLEAIIQLVQFMYDHNLYAELNGKSDYCGKCGYNKEILLLKDEDTGKYYWECPNCGNRDTSTMDVVRRTCGYKGTVKNGFNNGRLGDIANRVLHIDDIEIESLNVGKAIGYVKPIKYPKTQMPMNKSDVV